MGCDLEYVESVYQTTFSHLSSHTYITHTSIHTTTQACTFCTAFSPPYFMSVTHLQLFYIDYMMWCRASYSNVSPHNSFAMWDMVFCWPRDWQEQLARWVEGQQRALLCVSGCQGPEVVCCLLEIQHDSHHCLQCWQGHPGRQNTTWPNDYNRYCCLSLKDNDTFSPVLSLILVFEHMTSSDPHGLVSVSTIIRLVKVVRACTEASRINLVV